MLLFSAERILSYIVDFPADPKRISNDFPVDVRLISATQDPRISRKNCFSAASRDTTVTFLAFDVCSIPTVYNRDIVRTIFHGNVSRDEGGHCHSRDALALL